MIKVIDKELAWQLRHKVMWPNKPFDFIKIEDDDEGTHSTFFCIWCPMRLFP